MWNSQSPRPLLRLLDRGPGIFQEAVRQTMPALPAATWAIGLPRVSFMVPAYGLPMRSYVSRSLSLLRVLPRMLYKGLYSLPHSTMGLSPRCLYIASLMWFPSLAAFQQLAVLLLPCSLLRYRAALIKVSCHHPSSKAVPVDPWLDCVSALPRTVNAEFVLTRQCNFGSRSFVRLVLSVTMPIWACLQLCGRA